MSELVTVECSDEINTFESVVDLEFSGDLDAVLQSEKDRTQSGFARTYNGLSDTVCDPFFRNVTSAAIISTDFVEDRRLQERTFRFRFQISGTCRGCGRDTRLFDDATARALHEYPKGRLLQDSDCTCLSELVGETRAPSEDEYTVAYNEWLENAQNNGVIDPEHIEECLDTNELKSSSASLKPFNGGMVVGQLSLFIIFMVKVIL